MNRNLLEQFRQIQIRPHQTQLPGLSLKNVKNTIAVGSGKGGVGKSTLTVNLAVSLARLGARVGILDADIYGPSIPTMLGSTGPVEVIDHRYRPVLAHGVQAMSIGYLTGEENNTLIWRGPMLAKALIQMLDITAWDNLDYLFIDLPPGTGDIQLSLVQKIPLTGAIVVTTPQQVATNDASKALTMFEKTNITRLGLVENMSHHRCEACGHESALFGAGGAAALAEKHHTTLLGTLPLHQKIQEGADQAQPVALGSHPLTEDFTSLAVRVALKLNEQPLSYTDRIPPVVTASS